MILANCILCCSVGANTNVRKIIDSTWGDHTDPNISWGGVLLTKILRITLLLFILVLSVNSSCQAKWIEVAKTKGGSPLSFSTEIEYVPDSEQSKVIIWTKIDFKPDDPLANQTLPGLKTWLTIAYLDFSSQKHATIFHIFYDNNGNILQSFFANPIKYEPIDKASTIGIIYEVIYRSHTEIN